MNLTEKTYPYFKRLIFHWLLLVSIISPFVNITAEETKENYQLMYAEFSIRQNFGSGIGYNEGYTTIEEFVSGNIGDKFHPFFDLKAHKFIDNTYAANGGLGIRYFSEQHCKIIGINAFYDYRDTRKAHFQQVGGGLEWFCPFWNIRLNGYFPVGAKTGIICSNFQSADGYFLSLKKYNAAMKGVNLDFSLHVNKSTLYNVLMFGGPYYYFDKGKTDAIGGQIGFSLSIKQIFSLKISGTYDTLFEGRMQGAIAINLPLGSISRNGKNQNHCSLKRELLFEQVRRNEIIVLDKRSSWQWNY